jgi:glycosyltransferase involved in cell wall biosynthesis
MRISVCIITFNEEQNIAATLESVRAVADEAIVVDSGSTDTTVEIARARGARVFVEPWKGYAAQKNSAIQKAQCEWVLSLDADEQVSPELAASIASLKTGTNTSEVDGYMVNRRNIYFGRWLKHAGYYPDPKLRLIKRELAEFEPRAVHEDLRKPERLGKLQGDLLHFAYRRLEDLIEHSNRYSSLGAQMVVDAGGKVGFSSFNVVVRPLVRFLYAYFFRLGFLDGREGLLTLINHASYVSWKYAKAWELSRTPQPSESNAQVSTG